MSSVGSPQKSVPQPKAKAQSLEHGGDERSALNKAKGTNTPTKKDVLKTTGGLDEINISKHNEFPMNSYHDFLACLEYNRASNL
eukprot:5796863-Amphidinium_carterae.1